MKNTFTFLVVTFWSLGYCYGQIPTDIPHPSNNTPIDITRPADLIIYVILPIVAIGLYIYWRKNRRK